MTTTAPDNPTGIPAEDVPPVYLLDLAKVGNALATYPLIAHQFGHKTPIGTARDYGGRPYAPPENQFVIDVLTQPTAVLMARWYESPDPARKGPIPAVLADTMRGLAEHA